MDIRSSGIVEVSSDITSTGLDLVQAARMIVLDGGSGTDIGVAEGGAVIVSSGGVLTGCTVSSGGAATVLNNGYAQNVTVGKNGLFLVSSGGTAHQSIISSGGTQIVYAETMAASATVLDGGVLQVESDGHVRVPVVSHGGILSVQSGLAEKAMLYGGSAEVVGVAQNAEIMDGGKLTIQADGWSLMTSVRSGGSLTLLEGAFSQMDTVYDGGIMLVSSGGTANNTTVNSGGSLFLNYGASAPAVMENGGYVEVADGADVSFVKNMISGLTLENTSATVHAGTTATETTVNSGGRLDVLSGGKLTGIMTFGNGAVISMQENAILDFDISEAASGSPARVSDLSLVQGTPVCTLTVSAAQPDGVYVLAGGAAGFSGAVKVQTTPGESIGTLIVGETFKLGEAYWTLNLSESDLSLTIKTGGRPPTNLIGTKDRVSWNSTGAKQYIVECSTDNFAHVIQMVTASLSADLLELPAGTYQWRVKAGNGEEWAVGETFVSEVESTGPKVVQSNEDGNDDLFFASTNGTWENIYYAQHVGSINDWTGTNEIVSAIGKGRIQNLFFGSSDPNVLCLTDGENGDAIFVDDVYTDLPENVAEQTARLYKIQEIRAGAGDDIVDMTSQRFEYVGDGLTIRGGDGDDTIWTNKGDNMLFGDAGNDRIVGASGNDVIAGGIGNDRMHGGGGADVFAFCDNWGSDEVKQLATGTVALWFISGSEANWNASTLTYTDGENSVKVSGVTADKVSLKFGDDGSAQFATLSSMGAFFDATSKRIFEEEGKGILASL